MSLQPEKKAAKETPRRVVVVFHCFPDEAFRESSLVCVQSGARAWFGFALFDSMVLCLVFSVNLVFEMRL